MPVIKGLTYAIVTTDDVPRARRFFTEQLGLGTEDDMGDDFSQFTTRDGSLWAVMQAPPHASSERCRAVPDGRRRGRGVSDLAGARRRDGHRAVGRAVRPDLRVQGRGRSGAARLRHRTAKCRRPDRR